IKTTNIQNDHPKNTKARMARRARQRAIVLALRIVIRESARCPEKSYCCHKVAETRYLAGYSRRRRGTGTSNNSIYVAGSATAFSPGDLRPRTSRSNAALYES